MQTTVYIPYFISVVVMVSLINIMFANDTGVIANLLKALHLVAKDTNILGKESAFVPLYVLTGGMADHGLEQYHLYCSPVFRRSAAVRFLQDRRGKPLADNVTLFPGDSSDDHDPADHEYGKYLKRGVR